MDRKAVARETLAIMEQGYYEWNGKRIDIGQDMAESIRRSILLTPQQGETVLENYETLKSPKTHKPCGTCGPNSLCREESRSPETALPAQNQPETPAQTRVENISTVDAIRKLAEEGKGEIGVLNFASAKNPGGGFINGAMAQEESLAASSALYRTLTVHEEYYRKNRAQASMMYTDHAIYSPDVVFFRNGAFQLTEDIVKASVLTLPAVNMGQVMLKGEDISLAQQVMKRRMKLALAIFASQGAKNLILGAYGCGVFRNDPKLVAAWWRELLDGGMGQYFDSVFHAVLDHSKRQDCLAAFEKEFGRKE